MTREGIVLQHYSKIETRPFSMFTHFIENTEANTAWKQRALSWADGRFDKFGHRTELFGISEQLPQEESDV